MKKLIIYSIMVSTVGALLFATMSTSQEQKIAGTFYGDDVSKENYMFVMRIVTSFRTPWGVIPRDRKQAEKRVWDELILSYEAHRRQITVGKKELENKITETLKGDNVSFNWKESPDEYEQWVKKSLNESVELFENQMNHLVQVKKLREQVLDSIDPSVTEEEAFQEFLNENNSLSVKLGEFDTLVEAQQFYERVKNDPDEWERAVKEDYKSIPEDRMFRQPGFVALEFLIEMWKFPRKAVFDMIEMEIGEIYPPEPIYEGYGVFKILDVRRADESNFSKRKESYFKQLRSRKKYNGFKDWLSNLRENADIQIYMEPPQELFP